MAISTNQKYINWSSSFKKESLSQITFFLEAKDSAGTNSFFIKEGFEIITEAVAKKDGAKPDTREIEIKAVKETNFNPKSAVVLDEIYAQDMFAASRVLLITAPASWFKEVSEEIEKILNQPPEGAYIIFYTSSLDARTKLAKLVMEKSTVIEFPRMFDAPPIWNQHADSNDNDYSRWIANRARKYQKTISLQNAMLILSLIGTNLQTIDNQLNTLSIYDNHNKEIREEHIRAVIRQPAGISVYKVIDSVMRCNLGEALSLSRRMFLFGLASDSGKLEVDESVILNVYFIPNLFRRLKRVVDVVCLMRKGSSLADASRELSIPNYFVPALETDLKHFSKNSQLERAINILMDADLRSKTSSGSLSWIAEEIVLKICGNRS